MSKKVTLEEAVFRIKSVHGNVVTLDESTWTKASAPARFIDRDYGPWWALLKTVLRGSRHTAHKCVPWKKSRLLTVGDVNERLWRVHNGLVKLADGQRYASSHVKMVFEDVDFGQWVAMPYSVLAGHGHPTRGQKLKAKNARHSQVLKHWKTSEELICVGSYEAAFVNWCNAKKIDFDWQVPHKMPDGRTYYIDAFIKTGELANTWIEIKGTFARKNGHVGKEKWEWFHALYPNSQLWTRAKLNELGVYVK